MNHPALEKMLSVRRASHSGGRTQGILDPYSSYLSIIQYCLDALITIGGALAIGHQFAMEIGIVWQLLYGCIGWIIYQTGANIGNFYGSWRVRTLAQELCSVGFLWLFVIGSVSLLSFLFSGFESHIQELILPWGIGVAVLMLLYRSIIRMFLHRMRSSGFNTKKVAVVGCGDIAKQLIAEFDSAPWMGFQVTGQFVMHDTSEKCSSNSRFFLRDTNELVKAAREHEFDRLYVTWGMHKQIDIRQLIDELADTTVSLYLVPDLLVTDLIYSRIESINGMLTVSIYDTPAYGPTGLVKRIEDIVLSSFILCLISIPMLLIGIAVKLTSSGPVFFKQNRYGLDGKSFVIYKFRSMTVMENGDSVVQAKRFDSRITPVGAFLRRTSLDELPQFINVLQGRMSIVGPRPHAVAHNEQYRGLIRGYMLRHKVKPGITGWAQVNGWRGETDSLEKMMKRVEFDHEYIRNWSLGLDLKIILSTIVNGFTDKNAY